MNEAARNVASGEVKRLAFGLGADLCGIAPVERFNGAPAGFSPSDVYRQTKSIIVYAKHLPTEVLYAESCIPYTHVNALITADVDRLSLALSLKLETIGVKNVLLPSDDPYEYWDDARCYGRAILSMRHAGYLAGLGKLGKNNLLINDKYGNMIQIGALLTPERFDFDEIAPYDACPAACRKCLDACPRKALDGTTVNQKECRPISNFRTEKGFVVKKCWECRKACPNATGIKNKAAKS